MKKFKDLSPKAMLRIAYVADIFLFLLPFLLLFLILFTKFSDFYVPLTEIHQTSFTFGAFLGTFVLSFLYFALDSVCFLYKNIKELNQIRKRLIKEGKYSE